MFNLIFLDVHKEDSNVIAGSILAAGVLAAGVLAAVAIGTGAIVIIKVFRSCKRRQKPEQVYAIVCFCDYITHGSLGNWGGF